MASKADISPVDKLLRVLALVERSGDKDLAAWFSEAMEGYFEGVPLEMAFDLHGAGAGHEKPLTVWRRFQRDKAIRQAYQHIQGRSQADRVSQLRKILARPVSGNHASELWRAVSRAKQTGLHIPTSLSRLTEIVDQ
jgi:hypothetical protein